MPQTPLIFPKFYTLLLFSLFFLINPSNSAIHYPLKVQKHFYTSTFYIGTPPKRFELAFDLTSTVLWVYDDNLETITKGPDTNAKDAGIQIYKPSDSVTSEVVGGANLLSTNMLLETVDLDLYRDLVIHEGQSLGKILFGTIEYDPQLNLYVPFDGIFGIDRFLQDNMTTWPLVEMETAKSQVFTLYTPHVEANENQTMEISTEDAILTIGEDEPFQNCASNWTRLPMYGLNSTHGFFDFPLTRSRFSSDQQNYTSSAVFSFSTLTSFTTVDSQFYRLLLEKLKPKNETVRQGSQRYKLSVPCDLIKKAPLIEFWSGEGMRFVIPPRSYIQRYAPNKCVLKVRENTADFRHRWVLGLPFFHNYCVQFRYDNATVRFSRSIHKGEPNDF